MNKKHIYTVALDDTAEDGCITQTHQCGACCFNTECNASTIAMQSEPSPSDWQDGTLPSLLIPLNFN